MKVTLKMGNICIRNIQADGTDNSISVDASSIETEFVGEEYPKYLDTSKSITEILLDFLAPVVPVIVETIKAESNIKTNEPS